MNAGRPEEHLLRARFAVSWLSTLTDSRAYGSHTGGDKRNLSCGGASVKRRLTFIPIV